MPLYNNILLSKKGDSKGNNDLAKSSPSASMKLLQDHLLSKRRQQNLPPNNQQKTQKDRSQDSKSSQIISESTLHKPSDYDWDPEDEYDPRVPNSYEVLRTEFLKAEEQTLATRSRSGLNKMIPNLLEVIDKLDDDYVLDDKKSRGTAIAPPPSLVAGSNDADAAEKITDIRPVTPKVTFASEKSLDGASVAAKIMSKMGYKLGSGLGKDEQGINSPLEVEKSGLNVGRIVPIQPKPSQMLNQKPEGQQQQPQKEEKDSEMAELLRNSTRVLLLQNMVGPGEVDDDLEAETKEECKKYGDIVKCLIYEIPNRRVPDNEAVRIFVEFRKVESAIEAVRDLNGRYFGGRIVRASFYSLERFNRYELGPN